MTVQAGTAGLFDPTVAPSVLQQMQWAIAAGTGDAVIATYPTTVEALEDGLVLAFRAFAANTTTTPTFSPDGLQPYPMVKKNLLPLAAADIAGSGMEIMVRFNLANTCWAMINR